MSAAGFIERPNLPEGRVTRVLVSADCPRAIRALEELGVAVTCAAGAKGLEPPVDSHPDMSFCHLGGRFGVCASDAKELADELAALGFALSFYDRPGSRYPDDVGLNALLLGGRIVCNPKTVFPSLAVGRKVIAVKQGYSKCSVCPVDEESIITDDPSVAAAAAKELDVLLVGKGSVRLEGFDCGFIGGCSGKLSPDSIAFCGDIRLHSDWPAIKGFLLRRGVEPVPLFDGGLTDAGSLIPLIEEKQAD